MRRLAIVLTCCLFTLALGLVGCGGSSSGSASNAGASNSSADVSSSSDAVEQSQSSEPASSSATAPQDPDAEFLPALAAGLEARWKYSDQIEGQELTVEKRRQLAQSELDHIAAFKGAAFEDAELGKLAEHYIAAVEDSQACLPLFDTDYINFAKRWGDSYVERSLVLKALVDKYGFKVSDAYKDSLDGVVEDAKEAEAEEAVPADIRKAAKEDIPAALASAFQKADDGVYRATVVNPNRGSFDYYNFTVCLLDAKGGLVEQFPLGIEGWGSGAEATFEFAPTKEFASIGVLHGDWYATWQE